MGEGDLNEVVSRLQDTVTSCRLMEVQEVTRLRSDVGSMNERLERIEKDLYGPAGMIGNYAIMVDTLNRVSTNLAKAIDLLIPPDGSAGLLARLKVIEEIIGDVQDFKKWFFRAVGASLITAAVGIIVALFR